MTLHSQLLAEELAQAQARIAELEAELARYKDREEELIHDEAVALARVAELEALLGATLAFLPPPHPNRPTDQLPALRDRVLAALGDKP